MEEKSTVIENWSFSKTTPVKKELAQRTRRPPDAPTEGMKSKQSKRLGAKLRINEISKFSLFVSCRQMTEQLLSSILFLIASHLSDELIPRMFQHKIFHE